MVDEISVPSYLRGLRSTDHRNKFREKRSWSSSALMCSSPYFFSLPFHALVPFFPGSRFFRVVPVSSIPSREEGLEQGREGANPSCPLLCFFYFSVFLFLTLLPRPFFLFISEDKSVFMRMELAIPGLIQPEPTFP